MCKVPELFAPTASGSEQQPRRCPRPSSPCLGDNGSAGDEILPQQMSPCHSSGDAPLPSHPLTITSWLAPALMSTLRGEGTMGLGTAPRGSARVGQGRGGRRGRALCPRPSHPTLAHSSHPFEPGKEKETAVPCQSRLQSSISGVRALAQCRPLSCLEHKGRGTLPNKSIFSRAACGRGEGGGPGCR